MCQHGADDGCLIVCQHGADDGCLICVSTGADDGCLNLCSPVLTTDVLLCVDRC